MKVLFDQNCPRPLARYLTKHVVTRSAQLGWEELKNGNLIAAAEGAGFEAMVSADRNIKYQQNLANRKIALVILPSGQWPAVKDQLQEVVDAVDAAAPRSFKGIPFRRAKPPMP